MNRFLLSLALLFIAAPALAQDDAMDEATPTFITTVHQCDLAKLDDLVEHDRERSLPILQALVDDGSILSAGNARHQWGDEFNLMTWISGDDMASALAGWEAAVSQYGDTYPDDTMFGEVCPTHRDYFYTRRAWSARENPPAVDPENPPTLAVSYYSCDWSMIGDLVEDYREKSTPIAQALVNEGALGTEGLYTHDWGDEWNVVITRTAADIGALDSALSTFGERYEAEHGEDAPNMLEEHCSAHKDNVYWMVMSTN
jgi:hypothetical protein